MQRVSLFNEIKDNIRQRTLEVGYILRQSAVKINMLVLGMKW